MYKYLVIILFITIINKTNAQVNIIHFVEKEHHFSSINKEDKFQIILTGDNIIDAEVTIRILTTNDSILFKESYSSVDLIGYGLIGEKVTVELQEKYILKRMNEFFDKDNFNAPAIGLNDTCDSDYSNCEIWNILQKDQTAISFYYLIGEEIGCRIAYSKELKKVVKFFCCC